MSEEDADVLPRDRPLGGGRYDGYASPIEVGAQLSDINAVIRAGEWAYLVEQAHAIDLNLAEYPGAGDGLRELPAPDFGMGEKDQRELGKAVKKLRRTT